MKCLLKTANLYIYVQKKATNKGLQQCMEAYKKGLIDPELYTEDSSMSAAKRMDNR